MKTSIEENVVLQDVSPEYYDINGLSLKAPKRGFNIVKGKDGVTRKVVIKQ